MRSRLGPGWLPAAVGYLLIAFALTSTGVSLVDVLVFTVYVALGLALPGTLLWRFVEGDRTRPFVSDVVLGTCLAYAVELFWYVGVRAAGVPLLVLAWPLLVVAASLLPRWRARLWRPPDVHRMTAGWSWGMTAIVLLAFVLVAQTWSTALITPGGLRAARPDMAYHLSLVAELRHHLPVSSPVVDGEPLYYHWFLHAEVAAASWATGIEPVVLLERLSVAPMIVLTLMGAALLAGRLTGFVPLGLLAPALLVAGGVTSMATTPWGEMEDLWLSVRLYDSPTTTFAQVLLIPVLAAGMRLLRSDVPAPRRLWVTAALLLAALSAAKVTALPIVMAGFLGVVVLGALRRRLEGRALALFTMCAVVFLLARRLIYGGESRGVRWDPLAMYESHAVRAGLADSAESAGLGLAVLLLAVHLVQQLIFAAGVVGLARRGRWLDPSAQLLFGAALAGTVASFTLAANANAQLHFMRTTPVVLAIASAWGLSVLLPHDRPKRLPHVLVATALVTAALAAGLEVLGERGLIGLEAQRSPWGLVQPYVLAALGVLALVAASVLAARRRPLWHGTTGAVAVVGCLGLGLPSAAGLAVDVVGDPVPHTVQPAPEDSTMIGVGGVTAARWLRGNSDPDDLVATNRHCTPMPYGCDNRLFWLAAFSERGVLLEGWSYQVRTASRALRLDARSCCLPFWDPPRLQINDAAFRGAPRAVKILRDRYDVRWMVLDRRSPSRLDRLRELADVRYRDGDYVVLELLPAVPDV